MGRLSPAAAGAVLGVAAGLMYVGVMLGTPGALILVYLTQLPLFAAGLWLGVGAAVAAGVTGSLVLLVVSDLLGAALFAALNAVPVALLVRQALLARRRADGTYAWYPPGLLTAWLTGYALAGIGAAMLLLGGPEAMHESLRGVLATVLDRMYGRRGAEPRRGRLDPRLDHSGDRRGVMDGYGGHQRRAGSRRARPFCRELASVAEPGCARTADLAAYRARDHGGGGGVRRRGAVYRHQRDDRAVGRVLPRRACRAARGGAAAVASDDGAGFFLYDGGAVRLAVSGRGRAGLLDIWLGLRRRLAPQGVNSDG